MDENMDNCSFISTSSAGSNDYESARDYADSVSSYDVDEEASGTTRNGVSNALFNPLFGVPPKIRDKLTPMSKFYVCTQLIQKNGDSSEDFATCYAELAVTSMKEAINKKMELSRSKRDEIISKRSARAKQIFHLLISSRNKGLFYVHLHFHTSQYSLKHCQLYGSEGLIFQKRRVALGYSEKERKAVSVIQHAIEKYITNNYVLRIMNGQSLFKTDTLVEGFETIIAKRQSSYVYVCFNYLFEKNIAHIASQLRLPSYMKTPDIRASPTRLLCIAICSCLFQVKNYHIDQHPFYNHPFLQVDDKLKLSDVKYFKGESHYDYELAVNNDFFHFLCEKFNEMSWKLLELIKFIVTTLGKLPDDKDAFRIKFLQNWSIFVDLFNVITLIQTDRSICECLKSFQLPSMKHSNLEGQVSKVLITTRSIILENYQDPRNNWFTKGYTINESISSLFKEYQLTEAAGDITFNLKAPQRSEVLQQHILLPSGIEIDIWRTFILMKQIDNLTEEHTRFRKPINRYVPQFTRIIPTVKQDSFKRLFSHKKYTQLPSSSEVHYTAYRLTSKAKEELYKDDIEAMGDDVNQEKTFSICLDCCKGLLTTLGLLKNDGLMEYALEDLNGEEKELILSIRDYVNISQVELAASDIGTIINDLLLKFFKLMHSLFTQHLTFLFKDKTDSTRLEIIEHIVTNNNVVVDKQFLFEFLEIWSYYTELYETYWVRDALSRLEHVSYDEFDSQMFLSYLLYRGYSFRTAILHTSNLFFGPSAAVQTTRYVVTGRQSYRNFVGRHVNKVFFRDVKNGNIQFYNELPMTMHSFIVKLERDVMVMRSVVLAYSLIYGINRYLTSMPISIPDGMLRRAEEAALKREIELNKRQLFICDWESVSEKLCDLIHELRLEKVDYERDLKRLESGTFKILMAEINAGYEYNAKSDYRYRKTLKRLTRDQFQQLTGHNFKAQRITDFLIRSKLYDRQCQEISHLYSKGLDLVDSGLSQLETHDQTHLLFQKYCTLPSGAISLSLISQLDSRFQILKNLVSLDYSAHFDHYHQAFQHGVKMAHCKSFGRFVGSAPM